METKLVENMAFYEIILLILGCLLFLVALTGIIVNIIRSEPLKKYLPLIFISIVMIGFPGINKVTFLNDFISLEKYSRQYEDNPSDEEAFANLAESYKRIKTGKIKSPEEYTAYANAAMLLEDNETSIEYAEKALEMDKGFTPANEIKTLAETKKDNVYNLRGIWFRTPKTF